MNNNANPCSAHFVPNCTICFPTNVTTHANPINGPDTGITPLTVVTADALPVTTSTATASAPPLANVVNVLAPTTVSTSMTAANSVSSSVTLNADKEEDTKSGTKRKGSKVVYMSYLLPKRKKKAIIDCPVAQHFLRRLKLTNQFFNSGKVLAWALQPDDPRFRDIYEYVANGQVHGYGIKIISIIQIVAKALHVQSEEIPFDFNEDPYTQDKYRMMLWHGTSRRAVASILENGLRLPRKTGSMFGAGIYFADRASKSAQYCNGPVRTADTAFLFLCDVFLGRIIKCRYPLNQLKSPPPTITLDGKELRSDSVKGCGCKAPDKTAEKVIDGCVWPLGKTVMNTEEGHPFYLNFNEYVVYDTKYVRPKYLVKVEFTKNPHFEKID